MTPRAIATDSRALLAAACGLQTRPKLRRVPNGLVDGKLAATCWCERTVVYLNPDDIGRATKSCGPNCKPE